MEVEKEIKKEQKLSKKPDRFAQKENKVETGVLYVGHLPYGFVEDGLKEYFSQYGEVLRVKLMRSKKTARSKGYAFVEFKEADVARIAAKSMNGYLMYGRPLDVRYIETSQRNKFQLVRSDKKFKFVPWQIIHKNAVNAEKTDEQLKKSLANLIIADKKKAQRLEELGIKYTYTQYSDL